MTRPRRRVRLAALGAALVLLVSACSDAHTEEEKAWTDDGIDPRVVTVYYSPRLTKLAGSLIDRFQIKEHSTRFLLVRVEDNIAIERLGDAAGTALWLGPNAVLATGPAIDEVAPVGNDLLSLAWLSEDGGSPPPMRAFGSGGIETSLCDPELSCGLVGRTMIEAAGVTPDPDIVDNEAWAAGSLFLREVRATIVHRTYAVQFFPRVDSVVVAEEFRDPIPYSFARYGDADGAVMFMGWLKNETDLGHLITTTSGMEPTTSEPAPEPAPEPAESASGP